MENKNKNLWIWVLVILVVVIGLVFWATSSSMPAPVAQNNPVVAPVVSTEDTSVGSVNTGAAVSISYADALIKYKNARI